ncbi:unnamed protein product [Nezara viridula]|uniref:Peptidase S1 domain-containing protein n=1 Tax=Nezara viridula TaxID=85310 RepID=A0A9P0H2P0_NEZVI|nr:unnamed protein product [Nezara viridula]
MKIPVIMFLGLHVVAASRYGQSSCSCKSANLNIINGTVAAEDSHPWAVALMSRGWGVDYYLFCGGSIITPRHVLTAAHCLNRNRAYNVWIAAGQQKISQIKKENLIPSKHLFVHEHYNPTYVLNDIGLVLTQRKIQFTPTVRPICLPNTKLELADLGAKVTVVGWGMTSISDPSTSDELRQVELDVLPLEECVRSYPNLFFENQLCTYMEGKSPFRGDSGSPVIWKRSENRTHVIQVGLVSLADRKARRPSVQTDVTAFIDWIEDMVEETTPNYRICTGK